MWRCETCQDEGVVTVPLWQDRETGVWETEEVRCGDCPDEESDDPF